MEKQKNEDKPVRVYKSYFGGWLFMTAAVFLAIVHIWMLLKTPMNEDWFTSFYGSLIFCSPIYAILILYTFISTNYHYLVIYHDGIEQRVWGGRFFSYWEDLSHFEFRPAFRTTVVGIVTQKIQKRNKRNLTERVYLEKNNFIALSNVVAVPSRFRFVSFWSYSWEIDTEKLLKTDFGKDLYHYAPHLFETEKAKR